MLTFTEKEGDDILLLFSLSTRPLLPDDNLAAAMDSLAVVSGKELEDLGLALEECLVLVIQVEAEEEFETDLLTFELTTASVLLERVTLSACRGLRQSICNLGSSSFWLVLKGPSTSLFVDSLSMVTGCSTLVIIESRSDSLQVLQISISTTLKSSLAPLNTSLSGGRSVFSVSAAGKRGIFPVTSMAGGGGGFSRTTLDGGRGGALLAGGEGVFLFLCNHVNTVTISNTITRFIVLILTNVFSVNTNIRVQC